MPDLPPPKPRKIPVQARSAATLAAIHEAAIQVLLRDGYAALTTTRVAQRAGVSVGTLYQYLPDKRALLAAVLRDHLAGVATAVEAACAATAGQGLEAIARALCAAFLAAKLDRPEVSAALYAPAASLDGQAVVRGLMARAQARIAAALADCADRHVDDPEAAALVLSAALIGPVQAVLEVGAPAPLVAMLRVQLPALALGYLERVSRPR